MAPSTKRPRRDDKFDEKPTKDRKMIKEEIDEEIQVLRVKLAPKHDEVEELKLLNKNLAEELESVKRQLKKKDVQVNMLMDLLQKSEQESKKKIEEAETNNTQETANLNSRINYLQVIRDKEREKNQKLTKKVNTWKNKANTAQSLVDSNDAKIESLKRKVREFEEQKWRGEQRKGAADTEMDRMFGRFKEECSQMLESTKAYMESVNSYASRLEEMRRDESAVPHGPTCPLPSCQICMEHFSETRERTPRILECGHTVCEECANSLGTTSMTLIFGVRTSIKCPFDRNETFVMGSSVRNLPKNFTILECIAGNRGN